MTARWWAFGLWAVVAASALYWGLRLFVPGQPTPAHATVATGAEVPRGDLTRLFGVDAPVVAAAALAPPPSTRFQLLGVVAPRSGAATGEGIALIAIDGKPARAYRVGAAVDGETTLQAVRARGASLGPRGGAPTVALDIPPPMPAATGTLPIAGAPAAPAAAGPMRPPGPTPLPAPGPILRPSAGVAPGVPQAAPPQPGVAPRPATDQAQRPDGVQTQ